MFESVGNHLVGDAVPDAWSDIPTAAELAAMWTAIEVAESPGAPTYAVFTPGHTLPPGPCAAAALDVMEPAAFDDHDLLDLIGSWERLACWAQARQAVALAEFSRRRPARAAETGGRAPGLTSRYAADEIAPALRLSTCAASDRLGAAETICARLPGTLRAWTAGAIDALKARAIADAAETLDARGHQQLERRVLPRAVRQTIGQLRASLARAVAVIDPDGVEERHTRGVQDRRVELTPGSDGMAQLWALLPADRATRLDAVLSECARACAGDGRTIDQRRADALTDLADPPGVAGAAGLTDPASRAGDPGGAGRCDDPDSACCPDSACDTGGSGSTRSSDAPNGSADRCRPALHVTVAASTLLGLDNAPGELAGFGPIPASLARELAADATWRRLITDRTSGALLDLGRHTYRPSAALADFVRARDRTCRFPGCRQPAHRTDLDHTVPYPTGRTNADNLAALCRRHHLLKHETGWQLRQNGNGALTWTSPTGHRYHTKPEPRNDTDAQIGPNPAGQPPPTDADPPPF